MSAFFNLTRNSFWKVSRNLIRDFRELELMQSTNHMSLDRFVTTSENRTKETIKREFETLHFTSIIFENEPMPLSDGVHILCYGLEGKDNLRRALPYFGNIVVQLKNLEGERQVNAAVMSFPGLGQVFYAEKGQGAWFEKYEDRSTSSTRLRATGAKEITMVNSVFAENNPKKYLSRDFGSIFYDIALFASGKYDAILLEHNDIEIVKLCAELFAKESGGYSKELEEKQMLLSGNNIKLVMDC